MPSPKLPAPLLRSTLLSVLWLWPKFAGAEAPVGAAASTRPSPTAAVASALAAPADASVATAVSPTPTPTPLNHWTDADGNFHRRAATGHVSNYDEARVGSYVLPDPLRGSDGTPVNTAGKWWQQRRSEILELYLQEIYGRLPETPPTVRFIASADQTILGGRGRLRVIKASFGTDSSATPVALYLYLPAAFRGREPLLMQLLFRAPPDAAQLSRSAPNAKPSETPLISEVLARGYAYAAFRYTDVEPDGGPPGTTGVRGGVSATDSRASRPGDSWGAISAWAWGASRMLDYLITLPEINGDRVALIGHSRLGKTVLWAAAQDERFALVFSSCAGEMGSSLARRDFGETVDDMAGNFAAQFAQNFHKYQGNVNNLPVDAHELIALLAPRPVLITGGTKDQWADPRGEFLAEVAASPVYKLLGKRGLSSFEFPAADSPMLGGDLAFLYHTGPHAIVPEDWQVFFSFAERYLHPQS